MANSLSSSSWSPYLALARLSLAALPRGSGFPAPAALPAFVGDESCANGSTKLSSSSSSSSDALPPFLPFFFCARRSLADMRGEAVCFVACASPLCLFASASSVSLMLCKFELASLFTMSTSSSSLSSSPSPSPSPSSLGSTRSRLLISTTSPPSSSSSLSPSSCSNVTSKSLRTNRSFLCASTFFSLTTNIKPNPMTSCAGGRNCLSTRATFTTPGGSLSPASAAILLTQLGVVHHADVTARDVHALLRHITAAPACVSEYDGTAR
mmetsp:Transcript_7852/g.28913  ORF Transcript_7852/g.28913 Transcript_7852/m.28913 type:complete len:267 (+) Transcript_7852:694-1494(+)